MAKANNFDSIRFAALGLLVACSLESVTAGTKGAYMNSAGYGKAVDSVVYGGVTNTASSVATYYPCAAVNPSSTFSCTTPGVALPPGAPATVFCQSRGAPNYLWSIQSYVTGGSTADNPELESRANIVAANCAAYAVDSQAVFVNDHSGAITVNANATTGAAIWLRGFEFMGDGVPQSLDDLKGNSLTKWDILLVGPFDLNSGNCTALTIPFTVDSSETNLYFVVDGVAKSVPFMISCPGDVVFGCTDQAVYPTPQVSGGCGKINVSYSPSIDSLPNGVPTLVTVTASDEAGNSANCTFTATRNTLAFNGFYSPIGGTGGDCLNPLRTINRGSIIPVKFDVSCSGAPLIVGKPNLSIQQCPGMGTILTGDFQETANVWHFNLDTTGFDKGTYRLIATLQDGSTKEVFIKLK